MARIILPFITLILAALCASAEEQQLISRICLADGEEFNQETPVPPSDILTFSTVDENITGYWTISAEKLDGDILIIANSQENSPSQVFALDTNSVDWSELKIKRFYNSDPKDQTNSYAEQGYRLTVDFTSTTGNAESIVFMYYILPRIYPGKPELSNIHFISEEYDPDCGLEFFEGVLSFDVYSENATGFWIELFGSDKYGDYWVFTLDDWRNHESCLPFPCAIYEENVTEDGYYTCTMDKIYWDDVIVLYGMNNLPIGKGV